MSNAIAISSNLGLEKDIVEQAKNILISQKDPSILVVEKLQQTQQKLSKNLEEAQEIKETSLSVKKEYEENLSNIKKDKKKTIKINIDPKYRGIICIIIAAFGFAFMNLFVKLSGDLPAIEKAD